jgi:DNA-binding NtrC family response regulator
MTITNASILIIEDEASQRKALKAFLTKKHYQVIEAASQKEALHQFEENTVDVILSDMLLPDGSGEEILLHVKEIRPDVPLIIMTAYGNTEQAVSAMRSGAADYITKPLDLNELDLIVQRELERSTLVSENKILREMVEQHDRASGFITQNPTMQTIINTALRAAASDANILILGESGTGKEILARAIHAASPRSDQMFIPIHCAALSEGVIQSELFGHEKGAFTGATTQRVGRFEQAEGGTVFIDEVGDIPMNIQVQLLRVLQERTFERVGGNRSITANVRILAATNNDLSAAISRNAFREDLYYRLGVIIIEIPPLRKRREDIQPLIQHFIRRYAPGRSVELSREALDALMKYDWPGNIRELENVIERAVILSRNDVLTRNDFPCCASDTLSAAPTPVRRSLPDMIKELEKTMIRQAMTETQGNQSQAARILGLSERNLRYKLKKIQDDEPTPSGLDEFVES